MSEQDDRQLENYLAGDSPLSDHYRQAGDEGPPASLDLVVLANARRAIADDQNEAGVQRSGWMIAPWIKPLSTAAVIVLAAALVLEITLPRTQQATPESADVSFADKGLAGSSTDSDDVEAASQPMVAGDEARGYAPAIREEIPLDALLRQSDASRTASQTTPPSPLSVDKPTDQAMARTAARRDAKIAREALAARAVENSLERVEPQPEPIEPQPELAAPRPEPAAAPPIARSADRYAPAPTPRVKEDAMTASVAAPAAAPAPAPSDDSEVAADSRVVAAASARDDVELGLSMAAEQAGGRSVPSDRGFFSSATDAPELSDAQIQALTIQRIQWLVREGQDEEANQLLEELLERWPDLVLPEDFPLPDPREAP